MDRRLDRLVAWLCLVLLLGTGAVPSRGIVLCVEADGCVRVELKSPDADCRTCDGHEAEALDASDLSSFSSAGADGECPCFDLALPGGGDEERTAPRAADPCVSAALAPRVECALEVASPLAKLARGPRPSIPRVAAPLAHLRTVVLRV